MSGMLASCSASDDTDKKTALKVIVIPKFEIDDMSGDFPGEAQLFYEKYCGGCEETEVPNMSEDSHFRYEEAPFITFTDNAGSVL